MTNEMKQKLAELEEKIFKDVPQLKENRPKNCWTSDTLEAAIWRKDFEKSSFPYCEVPEYSLLFQNKDVWLRSRPIDKILQEYEQKLLSFELRKAFAFIGNTIKEVAKASSVVTKKTPEENLEAAMQIVDQRINGMAVYATDLEAYTAACRGDKQMEEVNKFAKNPSSSILKELKKKTENAIQNGEGSFKNITPEANKEINKLFAILLTAQKMDEIRKVLKNADIEADVSLSQSKKKNMLFSDKSSSER